MRAIDGITGLLFDSVLTDMRTSFVALVLLTLSVVPRALAHTGGHESGQGLWLPVALLTAGSLSVVGSVVLESRGDISRHFAVVGIAVGGIALALAVGSFWLY